MKMNILAASPVTMSSREIADLVDSRHDKVKQSIQRLADRGVIDLPPLGEYLDSLGRKATEYRIGKRDSYVIVAQLSPEFTARLVDRWQELEEQKAPSLPQNFAEALRLAADQADQIQQQQTIIHQQAPKVEALRVLSEAEGSVCVTMAAKELGMKPSKLFAWLRDNRWLYRRTDCGPYVAYQPRIDSGYLCHKVETIEREGQPDKLVEQVRITAKGLTRLAVLVGGAA
jgi:phage regulator Rha-like protein